MYLAQSPNVSPGQCRLRRLIGGGGAFGVSILVSEFMLTVRPNEAARGRALEGLLKRRGDALEGGGAGLECRRGDTASGTYMSSGLAVFASAYVLGHICLTQLD
jgi:hypothetical protein